MKYINSCNKEILTANNTSKHYNKSYKNIDFDFVIEAAKSCTKQFLMETA